MQNTIPVFFPEWQDLTYEEIIECMKTVPLADPDRVIGYIRAVERKLKQKNSVTAKRDAEIDWAYERREEARLDAMFDARYERECDDE